MVMGEGNMMNYYRRDKQNFDFTNTDIKLESIVIIAIFILFLVGIDIFFQITDFANTSSVIHKVALAGLALLLIMLIVFLLLPLALRHRAKKYINSNKDQLFETVSQAAEKSRQLCDWLLNNKTVFQNYIDLNGLNKIINCSNSVVSNAISNPIKFIIKYSDVNNSLECVERLDFCIEYQRNIEIFFGTMRNITDNLLNQLPWSIRKFCNKKTLAYEVCDIDKEIRNYTEPTFGFLYVSPAGKSQHSCSEMLTSDILLAIRNEVSKKIEKKGYVKAERSAMTNDLREAIKKRDNYTCKICGNSIYNEPNLLLEVDHIIPVSKGGKTEASNLQTLCWRCNRAKSNN